MGYKVNYNEMWELIDIIEDNGLKWNEQLSVVGEKYSEFNDPNFFKGKGATNINAYLAEVHGEIISELAGAIENLLKGSNCYRYGYQDKVDGGDGSKTGILHTTIVQDEIENDGTVSRNVTSMLEINSYIRDTANSTIRSILDIADISNLIYPDRIENALVAAKKIATDLNLSVLNYEGDEKKKLDSVRDVLGEVRHLISYQLDNQRTPVASYESGGIGYMCDFNKLYSASQKVKQQNIEMTEYYDEAKKMAFNRDELLEQERADKVEWIKWAVTGLCIVATVAVTIACPAASIATLAIMGGITGAVSSATDEVVDQYIKTGFENGVDVSKVVKAGLVGGTAGAIAGAVGGAIAGKASSIGQSVGKKILTEIGEGAVSTTSGAVVGTAYDVIEKAVTGKVDEIDEVVRKNLEEYGKNIVGDVVEGIVGPVIGEVTDKIPVDKIFDKMDDGIKKKIGKAVYDTVDDTVGDVITEGASALAQEGYEALVVKGEEFKINDVLDAVKEKAISGVFENGANNLADLQVDYKKEHDKSYRDKYFENTIKNKYGDNNFKVVEFKNGISVLKSDYDAAKAVTRQKGYDGKSARELLGLRSMPSEFKVRKVDINDIKNVDYTTESDILRFKINK